MATNWILHGQTMVRVRGGAHRSGLPIGDATDLGLTQDQIVITPTFYHKDMKVDDFGPDCPADVQQQLCEVNIAMTMIYYDKRALDICIDESLGGGGADDVGFLKAGSVLAPAGRLLSRFRNAYWSGWHYVAVSLVMDEGNPLDLPDEFRFRQCYLAQQPFTYPIGTEVTAVRLNWRAIPYSSPWLSGGTAGQSGAITVDGQVWHPRNQMQSSGAVIWDREVDTPPDPPEEEE